MYWKWSTNMFNTFNVGTARILRFGTRGTFWLASIVFFPLHFFSLFNATITTMTTAAMYSSNKNNNIVDVSSCIIQRFQFCLGFSILFFCWPHMYTFVVAFIGFWFAEKKNLPFSSFPSHINILLSLLACCILYSNMKVIFFCIACIARIISYIWFFDFVLYFEQKHVFISTLFCAGFLLILFFCFISRAICWSELHSWLKIDSLSNRNGMEPSRKDQENWNTWREKLQMKKKAVKSQSFSNNNDC